MAGNDDKKYKEDYITDQKILKKLLVPLSFRNGNERIKNPYQTPDNNKKLTDYKYFPIFINGQVEVVLISELKNKRWKYEEFDESLKIGDKKLTYFKKPHGNIVLIDDNSYFGKIKIVDLDNIMKQNNETRIDKLKHIHDQPSGSYRGK